MILVDSEQVPKMMRVGVKFLERISRTELTGALLDYWICVQSSHFANIYSSENFEKISRFTLLE